MEPQGAPRRGRAHRDSAPSHLGSLLRSLCNKDGRSTLFIAQLHLIQQPAVTCGILVICQIARGPLPR